MPLLGFAVSQPCSCFFNNLVEIRSEINSRSKFLVGNGRGLGWASTFYWNSICITKKVGKYNDLGRVEVRRSGLMIKAVATLEISGIGCKNEGVKGYQNILTMDIDSERSNPSVSELKSSSEESEELSEREKLRRRRISKANKGNTPWNKGRKHSPETLQRIKERTRLAMQDPKVKMKLVNLGHAQSEETKMKIGMGVRLGWERRRGRLMLQETCHYEWLNLIAKAAQKGLLGEEELEWDAYKTLSKQLEQEWLQSVEERKNMPRPKGNKRAPKSAEQRRKISEAISAKWADPDYRERVCSSLAKFHCTSERPERKPRVKPSGDRPIQKRSPRKEDKTSNIEKHETNQVQRARLKRPRGPSFKDPFASSKLEMIKNIRAQRAASVSKQSEAIFKAKLLIAEAEKAAAALEPAAQSNPHIRASLIESRMLIAEAIQFIESIKGEEQQEDAVAFENHNNLPDNSTIPRTNSNNQSPNEVNLHPKVNGVHSSNLGLVVNGNGSTQASFLSLESNHKKANCPESANQQITMETGNGEAPKGKIMKKWVRGKLVEVVEEES